jgi:dCMP deaminase
MTISPYEEMQKAVDIVNSSPHPTSKIAATLFGKDFDGTEFSISCTNYWPEAILQNMGTAQRVGNSSGTVHAETACILNAPRSDGASLCITDPFCPNCAKNIVEAGIKTIYIDHKGFNKDFAKRRSDEFDNMSMRICERAGINVYEIWRKEAKLVPILEIDKDYRPPENFPVSFTPIDKASEGVIKKLAKKEMTQEDEYNFAIAIATDNKDRLFSIVARSHPVAGYCIERDAEIISHREGKYSFIQEPVNRILMACSRYGMDIIDGLLYSSRVPRSREQVNILGSHISTIIVGDKEKAGGESAIEAMKLLEARGILKFNSL